MAIITNGEITYKGAVISTREHYWLDGMIEEYATVWDIENHTAKEIPFGYYGNDGQNLYGDSNAYIDCSTEVARDIIRTMKKRADSAFANSVKDFKKAIHKGDKAEVIRGRKVAKGTILEIFWVGEKPTWAAKNAPYWSETRKETELIAGGHDKEGNVVWIKAEYLKNLTQYKSPCAAERRKFIRSYIQKNIKPYILEVAKN